jgi:hypothetical protein
MLRIAFNYQYLSIEAAAPSAAAFFAFYRTAGKQFPPMQSKTPGAGLRHLLPRTRLLLKKQSFSDLFNDPRHRAAEAPAIGMS